MFVSVARRVSQPAMEFLLGCSHPFPSFLKYPKANGFVATALIPLQYLIVLLSPQKNQWAALFFLYLTPLHQRCGSSQNRSWTHARNGGHAIVLTLIRKSSLMTLSTRLSLRRTAFHRPSGRWQTVPTARAMTTTVAAQWW